jgi:hypothetical protein
MATKKITLNELRTLVKQIIKEESHRTIKLKIDGESITFFKQNDNGVIYVYGEDENGETYIDISTNIPSNPLIDAIWVEVGGLEEKIANKLPFLSKTNRNTKSGYNNYIMYEVNHSTSK